MSYLEGLDHESRVTMLAAMFAHEIPCVLITGGGHAPSDLLTASDTHRVPVLRTTVATPIAIARIGSLLDDALAVREGMDAGRMDSLGLGVLIMGESGIGMGEGAGDRVVR